MKQVFISGKNKETFFIIDDEDYDEVKKHKWYINRKGYAQRNRKYSNGRRDSLPVLLHGFILGKKIGFTIDHINENKLDNRKSNLRFITNTENIRRRGTEKTSTTGYKEFM